MNTFENYDMRKWQEGGLTLHPRSLARIKPTVQEPRFAVAAIFVPLVAMGSMLMMGNVPYSGSEHAGSTNTSSQYRSQYPLSRSESVFWFGTVQHLADPLTPVDSFEANAMELARQIRTGALTNLSAETLRLANAVYDPGRMVAPSDNGWIDAVAHAVARLAD